MSSRAVASDELVGQCLRAVPLDDVMADVAAVSAYDRYQSSRGIEAAATLVAERASECGLEEVGVESFPADGAARWWSFAAPVAWTPTRARLEASGAHGTIAIDHATEPCSIATYSAATAAGGARARLAVVGERDLAGAIAVVPAGEFARPQLVADLVARGALGFVTDGPCRGARPGPEHPGRIELDPDTPLFGFSVTTSRLEQLAAAAADGARADAVVEVDRSARMPVVSGVLPGERDGREVWLIGHLCHPRPGANDNASGVAAVLGVAAMLAAARRAGAWAPERTVRFVWGPEFVGTAAALYRRMEAAAPPAAVLNLDMVGEDQAQCGGPFVVERSPECRASLIDPIAEHVVGEVFARTAGDNGTWRPAPFTGRSDHALFATSRLDSTAVHLCHVQDRFNHSAGDSPDKVAPAEMRRATAAAAAIARIVAGGGALEPAALARVVDDWCAREEAAADRAAREHGDGDWGTGLRRHVHARGEALRALAERGDPALAAPAARPAEGAEPGRALAARWDGPLNLRALLGDLPPATRAAVDALIAADGSDRTLLLEFAIRADGRATRAEIAAAASYAQRRPIDPDRAARLLDALVESGWVTEVS